MVLPTPGGPIMSTLVASSKNRNEASSWTSWRSTDGWASKSKSSRPHGAGSLAKRSSAPWRRATVAPTSMASNASKNAEWLSLSLVAASRAPGRASAAAGMRKVARCERICW
jgi:hypothetical protein